MFVGDRVRVVIRATDSGSFARTRTALLTHSLFNRAPPSPRICQREGGCSPILFGNSLRSPWGHTLLTIDHAFFY